MECEFQVGDKVVCVHDTPPGPSKPVVLKNGTIYTQTVIAEILAGVPSKTLEKV